MGAIARSRRRSPAHASLVGVEHDLGEYLPLPRRSGEAAGIGVFDNVGRRLVERHHQIVDFRIGPAHTRRNVVPTLWLWRWLVLWRGSSPNSASLPRDAAVAPVPFEFPMPFVLAVPIVLPALLARFVSPMA